VQTGGFDNPIMLTDTARQVSRAMIRNALRAVGGTGMRVVADVVELTTLLFNLYDPKKGNKEQGSSDFEVIPNTPCATARTYFRPKLMNNTVVSLIYIPLLLLGCMLNNIVNTGVFFFNTSVFVTMGSAL
jgi:hypothetical protein